MTRLGFFFFFLIFFFIIFFFYNHNFDGAQVCNISFESSFFKCSFQEKYFLYFVAIFLELQYSCWYIIGMNSDRIKFKLLLQLKKTLTKEMVEVKFENHGL